MNRVPGDWDLPEEKRADQGTWPTGGRATPPAVSVRMRSNPGESRCLGISTEVQEKQDKWAQTRGHSPAWCNLTL